MKKYIEIRGRIQATQCFIICNKPVYHFLLNGYVCKFAGSLNFLSGDVVTIQGQANELSYTNTMGERKTMKEISVVSIRK